jgi:hypothetical protein
VLHPTWAISRYLLPSVHSWPLLAPLPFTSANVPNLTAPFNVCPSQLQSYDPSISSPELLPHLMSWGSVALLPASSGSSLLHPRLTPITLFCQPHVQLLPLLAHSQSLKTCLSLPCAVVETSLFTIYLFSSQVFLFTSYPNFLED